jgi:hypothetical protein
VVSIGSTQGKACLVSWNNGMMEDWNNGFLIGFESNLI